YSHFVQTQCGVRTDDRPSGEVDALAREAPAESAFLTLQALTEGFERTAGAVTGGRRARDLVVHKGGNVILEEFPEILDNQLWRTCLAVLHEPLVDPDDVNQFVGEV